MSKKEFVPVIERGHTPPKFRGRDKGYRTLMRQMASGDRVWMKDATMQALQQAARSVFGAGNYTIERESRNLEPGFMVWRLK